MTLKNFLYILLIGLWTVLYPNLYADDGYELWLKYKRIANRTRLQEYQPTISSILVAGESETCRIIRDELKRGLSSLLGKDIPLINSSLQNGTATGA